jgi:hypothetical protein
MPSKSLTRKYRWRIFLPSMLLFLLAVAWSGFWLFAADQTGKVMDQAIAREATQGRRIVCGERSIGGYPFRIEVRCTGASVAFDTAEGPLVVDADGFVAVAQLPVPSHVIVEASSPVTLGRVGGQKLLALRFKSARASLQGGPNSLEQVSILLDAPALERVDGGTPVTGLQATSAEVHARRSPTGAPGTFDLVAKAIGATAAALPMSLAQNPTTIELQVELNGAAELVRGVTPASLRDFAAEGGKLHLALLRAEQGDVVAEAKGDIGLDPLGRANGEGTLTIVGLGQLLTSNKNDPSLSWLWALLPLGKPGKLGDKPASSYAVRVVDGAISVGPLPLGSLPPLF